MTLVFEACYIIPTQRLFIIVAQDALCRSSSQHELMGTNIPEGCYLHTRRGENLKSHNLVKQKSGDLLSYSSGILKR
jgi:hypothetical protein